MSLWPHFFGPPCRVGRWNDTILSKSRVSLNGHPFCVQCSTYVTDTHTHPFNGPLSGTTWVGQYQKSKTNLDFTEARDSEWQWNPLGHMQVCTLLQTDNHASTPPLSFFTARCYASAVLAMGLCLSVTSRCSTKSAKRRITQTTPHDSPGTLVYWCQDLREIR